MKPVDSLHMKVLYAEMLESPLLHRFFDYWINRDAGARYLFPAEMVHGVAVPWPGEQVCRQLLGQLRMAETYYLSKDIHEVVKAASKTMPPEILLPDDVPSTHGWLWFEQPWMLTDVHGVAFKIRALQWSTEMVGKTNDPRYAKLGGGLGLTIWALTDLADKRDLEEFYGQGEAKDDQSLDYQLKLMAQGFRMSPMSIFSAAYGAYTLEMADQQGTIMVGATKDEHVEMVANDDGTFQYSAQGESYRVVPEPLTSFLQCLWRFQKQEIAARTEDHLRKTTQRALVRRQLLPKPVSIIHLRKRAAGGDTGVSYQLSHRFIVRGHWRRQWYASEQRHKSIYIQPFVKGPDDAPFLSRERVNAIVR